MPPPGGRSGKAGDHYEVLWAANQLIRVIRGEVAWVHLERYGVDEAELVVGIAGKQEFHQVKRQRTEGEWSISNLDGVLVGFRRLLDDDPNCTCVFVSSTSASSLQEWLDEPVRDVDGFRQRVNETKRLQSQQQMLLGYFGQADLSGLLPYLSRISLRTLDSVSLEEQLRTVLLGTVRGMPEAALAHLFKFVFESEGARLEAHDIWGFLNPLGHGPVGAGLKTAAEADVVTVTDRYLDTLREITVDGRRIPRIEADATLSALAQHASKSVLVVGNAGIGKSGVLRQVITQLRGAGWEVLAFRADAIGEVLDAETLGERLHLPGSPVASLAAGDQARPRLLVIDQLDAVSLISGRQHATFQALKEVVESAGDHPGTKLLVACRAFDLEHDHRLKALLAGAHHVQIPVQPLDRLAIESELRLMGMDPSRVSDRQFELLGIPLHLGLLAELKDTDLGRQFQFETPKDLFDAYCDIKRQQLLLRLNHQVAWNQVLDAVIAAVELTHQLTIPWSYLSEYDDDARAMASEGVLLDQGGNVSFFHEQFLDYAFARRFTEQAKRLTDLLRSGEQHLYRRAQVRQVLEYERVTRPLQFRADLAGLLGGSQIRYHIKQAALWVLSALADPTAIEWEVIRPHLEEPDGVLAPAIAQLVRRSDSWFKLLVELGYMRKWLASDRDAFVNLGIEVLLGHREDPRLAPLIEPYVERDGEWRNRLAFLMSWSRFGNSRPMFDILLRLIDRGVLDAARTPIASNSTFWDLAYGLAETHPSWAVEFASHRLRRELALAAAPVDGQDSNFGSFGQSHYGVELLLTACTGAPIDYMEQLLPLIVDIVRSRRSSDGYHDEVFAYRHGGQVFSMEAALSRGMEHALAQVANTSPDRFQAVVEAHSSLQSETLDYLFARGYAGSPGLGDKAIEFLLSDLRRLQLGTMGSSTAASAALVATASKSCDQTNIDRLERVLLNYYPEWELTKEGRRHHGYGQFALLRATPMDRLSGVGRRRRLELERKFRGTNEPEDEEEANREEPSFQIGFVGPPIPGSAAEKMTDEQWLRAFEEYSPGPKDLMSGGPRQLANLFAAELAKEPLRYASLALQISDELDPVYLEVALQAIATHAAKLPSDLIWDICRKAVARSDDPEMLRAALRAIEATAGDQVPEDILDIVLAFTGHSDPDREPWRQKWNGQPIDGGDPLMSGMGSVRGTAANAIAVLLAANHARLDRFDSAIRGLTLDPSPSVRAVAAHILLVLHDIDSALAVQLFEGLIAGEDAVLSTYYAIRLMHVALHEALSPLEPIIRRALASEVTAVRTVGGQLAGFAAVIHPEGLALAQLALDGDQATREGLAGVLAASVSAVMKPELKQSLLRLFNDEDEAVRDAAASAFWTLRSSSLVGLEDLMFGFIESRSFQKNAGKLVHALSESPAAAPAVVLALSRKFIDALGDRVGDIRYAESIDAETLSSLLIQNYAESPSETEQSTTLDLIDEMLRLNAYRMEETLREFERRPA